MKFQDDISNMNTYVRTYVRTSRNQYVPYFFKVGGIKNGKKTVSVKKNPSLLKTPIDEGVSIEKLTKQSTQEWSSFYLLISLNQKR